jgi:hypothetical protein
MNSRKRGRDSRGVYWNSLSHIRVKVDEALSFSLLCLLKMLLKHEWACLLSPFTLLRIPIIIVSYLIDYLDYLLIL